MTSNASKDNFLTPEIKTIWNKIAERGCKYGIEKLPCKSPKKSRNFFYDSTYRCRWKRSRVVYNHVCNVSNIPLSTSNGNSTLSAQGVLRFRYLHRGTRRHILIFYIFKQKIEVIDTIFQTPLSPPLSLLFLISLPLSLSFSLTHTLTPSPCFHSLSPSHSLSLILFFLPFLNYLSPPLSLSLFRKFSSKSRFLNLNKL